MSEQIILDLYGLIGWSFLCVVNGMFFGLAVYAFCCEVMKEARAKVDHQANQAKADELFAPVRVRAGK